MGGQQSGLPETMNWPRIFWMSVFCLAVVGLVTGCADHDQWRDVYYAMHDIHPTTVGH
jgi:hypothetical protein